MGNRIGGRRKAGVDERYTRPQGLYDHHGIDQKKLRKLILEAKLAPCYPGADEASGDLEECPICFLVTTREEISSSPSPFLSLSFALPSFEFRPLLLLVTRGGGSRFGAPVFWKPFGPEL
jgi:hypothetical protein